MAGIEHVGLGSDADVDAIDPRTNRVRPRYNVLGLKHPRRVFELTEGLIRRGYTDRQIELVLGGNFQRALGEIWGRRSSRQAERISGYTAGSSQARLPGGSASH